MEPSFLESQGTNNLAKAIASLNGENSYAVPNRFEVLILPPGKGRRWKAQEVSLRCESILLPGRNLNTLTDGMPYGPTREIVDGVTYAEDISMTFVASGGLDERIFFEEWQLLAFNEKTWNVGYYDDYVGTVEIYLLNRQDERRFGIKLIEAFPKTIAGTDLSQATNNEIIKTSVSFTFRYWESLDQERSTTTRVGKEPPNQSEKIFNLASRKFSANMPATVSRLGESGGNVGGAYTGPEENYR
jgi:hypothetical protein